MTRILLVGNGKMGGALLQGWSKNPDLIISTLDPHTPDADYQSAADIQLQFDVIVLAVKPQIIKDTLSSLAHLIMTNTLILSIAAGKTIAFYESLLGKYTSIIRSMPNTPALIGKGITVLCGNTSVTPVQKNSALNLLNSVGLTEWIDDENLMDAVTAVSGSGPAYVFHMIESLTAAGITAGLPPALSERLARQTVIGAASLAETEKTTSAALLRENVTSPNGTTEAALKILMDKNGLTDIITRTVLAAQKRGKELAS